MTHSLHRQGTRENLANDFTIYCLPSIGINDAGSGTKRCRFLEITLRNHAVCAGQTDIGNTAVYPPQELLRMAQERFRRKGTDGAGDGMAPCICCDNKEDVVNILRETLAEDFGLCVMVQGVVEEVQDCLRQVGLTPHTVHHSLGFWGRTEKLPPREVLEITTMCGHGMVTPGLVEQSLQDVISGRTTPKEAARQLAKPCVCGIFNISRAADLLEQMASSRRG
ncbi:MAG: hypothetical protein ABID87_03340 [Chloroflexota bacterium]